MKGLPLKVGELLREDGLRPVRRDTRIFSNGSSDSLVRPGPFDQGAPGPRFCAGAAGLVRTPALVRAWRFSAKTVSDEKLSRALDDLGRMSDQIRTTLDFLQFGVAQRQQHAAGRCGWLAMPMLI